MGSDHMNSEDELNSAVEDFCSSWIDLPPIMRGESEDEYYQDLAEDYQYKITDTKRIQKLIISSSRLHADQQQYGIECLQEGIEYFMKGIQDIHGGTRSGAELQFKKGKHCIFKGLPCDYFSSVRGYILFHRGTNGSPINSEYNYQQGIEYIRGPEPTPSNRQVLPEHEYNNYEQGMEYIRGLDPTPYRCEVQPAAHEYKYQQGMEYIRGPEPTPTSCELQAAHKYSNQQGMEYIRGPEPTPTPTPSDRQVLPHGGYNNQQGMEHIRVPSNSPVFSPQTDTTTLGLKRSWNFICSLKSMILRLYRKTSTST